MHIHEELARAAYAAYGRATEFKNFQGDPMPVFGELRETQKRAWKSAAVAAYERACQDLQDRITRATGEVVDG